MKITKKLSALLLVAVLSIGMATAQVGVQVGYTNSKNKKENFKALQGFHVGATYDMSIQGPVSLQYGLLYNLGQSSQKILSLEHTYTHHSIDIPVRVAFTYPVGMLKLTAFAGPNFNYGIAYTNKYEVKTALGKIEKKSANMYDDDKYSRFNLQLGGGLAVQYGKIGVKASYDLGLIETYKDDKDSKFSAFKVGVFYNF